MALAIALQTSTPHIGATLTHALPQPCRSFGSQIVISCVSFEKQLTSLRLVRRFAGVMCDIKVQSYIRCCATFQSGLEDAKSGLSMIEKANFIVEPLENEKIKLKVGINSIETQRAYDFVLSNLAKSAPPVPGFRKAKGGRTTLVPKAVLLQMLGANKVKNFVIQEIISSSLKEYVDRENINAKKEFTTVQTDNDLNLLFKPGEEFAFDAVIELEKPVVI